MFVSKVEIGLRFAMPTMVCAARWKTVSTSYSPSVRSSSCLVADVPADDLDLLDRAAADELALGDPVADEADDVGARRDEPPDEPAPTSPVAPVTRTDRSCQYEFTPTTLS